IPQDVDLPDPRQPRPNAGSTREPERTVHGHSLVGPLGRAGAVGEPGAIPPCGRFTHSRPLGPAADGSGLVAAAEPPDQGAPGEGRDGDRGTPIEPGNGLVAPGCGGVVFRRGV